MLQPHRWSGELVSLARDGRALEGRPGVCIPYLVSELHGSQFQLAVSCREDVREPPSVCNKPGGLVAEGIRLNFFHPISVPVANILHPHAIFLPMAKG